MVKYANLPGMAEKQGDIRAKFDLLERMYNVLLSEFEDEQQMYGAAIEDNAKLTSMLDGIAAVEWTKTIYGKYGTAKVDRPATIICDEIQKAMGNDFTIEKKPVPMEYRCPFCAIDRDEVRVFQSEEEWAEHIGTEHSAKERDE